MRSDVLYATVAQDEEGLPARADNSKAGLLGFGFIIGVCILFLGPIVQRYGAGLFLPSFAKRITLTPDGHRKLVEGHQFVVIGGPHRGGTTLLWRLLAAHPLVSGFPEKSIESDFSEGSFLQSVLPTFGVGAELLGPKAVGGRRGRSFRSDDGLGRYGLAASSHMTETHSLNTDDAARTLLSEWGYYWNLSRPTLVEKTPTNMLTSRLLQGLLSRPLPPPNGHSTRFLFITRHPLAVSLAHKRWPCCVHMSIPSLVVHWLHTHRVLAADLPHLHHVKVLRYEDLAKRPGPAMKRILTWLKLPPARIDVSDVSASTNQKYEQEYCSKHLNDLSMAKAHCVSSGVLQPLIAPMGLDYDVRDGGPSGFGCIASKLKALAPPSSITPCSGIVSSTQQQQASAQLVDLLQTLNKADATLGQMSDVRRLRLLRGLGGRLLVGGSSAGGGRRKARRGAL